MNPFVKQKMYMSMKLSRTVGWTKQNINGYKYLNIVFKYRTWVNVFARLCCVYVATCCYQLVHHLDREWIHVAGEGKTQQPTNHKYHDFINIYASLKISDKI